MPFAVPQQAQFKTEETTQRRRDYPWQQPQQRRQPQYRQPQQYGGRGQMMRPAVEPQYRQPQRQGIMRGEWDQPPVQRGGYRTMEYPPQRRGGYDQMRIAEPPPKQYYEQSPEKYYGEMQQKPLLDWEMDARAQDVYADPLEAQTRDLRLGGRYRDPLMYRGGY